MTSLGITTSAHIYFYSNLAPDKKRKGRFQVGNYRRKPTPWLDQIGFTILNSTDRAAISLLPSFDPALE
ncbi:hypothetical protein JJE66_30750 [Bradyrhizobium diazoefficiens]|uniref:hypothetical protein n=1 Tax=Bradyrhizobium diazoefficiens TaxID=1355477 RepID=UPI00190DBF1C|nr:hypothetical protein [Bradyrhizobium diazoefficiens]MBK3665592.1 hypothetical protein [Bradyrhizobium diazoefficiens]QQO13737.1 hypothetical protein JJB99_30795 [Bradyrhizobium diazoefficiens]